MTGDRIATGQNSRGEVQFDSANLLRIGGNAEIHLALLETGRYHLEIARGTVTYRILHPSRADVELNTPSVSVRPEREGTFRISVTEAGESEVTARQGDVEVFTPQGTQWIYGGQTMMARGSSADPEFQMEEALPEDAWDRWNETRDRAAGSDNSARYVPPGVYGTQDLDSAGTWISVAPYGNVWRPTGVAAGWAPYRNGHWVWMNFYGWTWVSYDSWGWAPYHYGRWFSDPRWGWAWYPGTLGTTAFWSPALVGFFGYGGGVGVSAGFGFANIGWVPLAPFETFHAWWGGSYGSGLNRGVTVTNVSAYYRNARIANGISGMPAGDFTAGRFGSVQRVSRAQVESAGMVSGRLPLTPGGGAHRFSDRAVANIPRPSGNTQFYSRSVSAAGGRQSTNPQASPGYHRFGQPGPSSQSNRTPPARGNVTGQRQGVLQRFGEPGGRSQNPSGWRSFGIPGSSAGGRQPYNPPPSRAPQRSAPSGGRSAGKGGGRR
ncbi:MAG TPA: DUF6600 domain-containing protein [Bryobacteraceae bacterium]|nr:DUF6600 domain-containing protein [Bryobacteraceae bacterium]